MIRAKRVPHVMGVEEEAVPWPIGGAGTRGMARRAAILHDCTKYLELDDQLRLCRQYGVELDELEQQAVKLLHAKTGPVSLGTFLENLMRCTRQFSGTPRPRRT